MNDVRFALRQLARKPGFTVMVALTLALGIGVTTAIFSVVNAALLRPLPYKDPQQLVRIYTEFPTFANGGLRRFAVSPPEYFQLKRETKLWDSIDAYITTGMNLAAQADPVRARGALVTGGLMPQLGVAPLMGRLIGPDDDLPGVPRVALISHGLWQTVFAGATNILGREVFLEGEKVTIVGVMPPRFNFPIGDSAETEIWSAFQLDPAEQNWGSHFLNILGRVKPGYTVDQARGELAALVEQKTKTTAPNTHNFHNEFHPLVSYGFHDEIVRSVKPALQMLFGAVCFVLLIACVNVGNLLLARAEHRQKEIAIRSAIGAGFWRLIRQFVIEGVILSLLGAAVGLLLAYHGLEFAKSVQSGSLPRAAEIGIDLNVCLFTLGLSIVTGVLFGLTPIAHVLGGKEYLALKSAAASTTGNVRAHRFQQSLVVAEMALALMLLVGAGLMVRAFWALQRVEGGFSPQNVLTASVSLPQLNLSNEEAVKTWIRLDEKLRALPGLDAAGLASGLPPIYNSVFNDTEIEGFDKDKVQRPQNVDYYQFVSAGFFPAMGFRLVDGRFFDERDSIDTLKVCVINRTMARAFWGNKNPIGRRIRPGGENAQWTTIIGVIEDAKNAGLDQPAGTELYFPLIQSPSARVRTIYIAAKSRSDTAALATTIRGLVKDVAPGAPVSLVRTMDQVVSESRSRPRFLTQLLGVFSITALILASVGIYGVISYSVAQRTREFGVRMALGARTTDVLRLVLGRGVTLTLCGLLIGLIGAVALTRFLATLLFGVTATDPLTFTLVPVALTIVALAASYLPARRATRVDPLNALRYE